MFIKTMGIMCNSVSIVVPYEKNKQSLTFSKRSMVGRPTEQSASELSLADKAPERGSQEKKPVPVHSISKANLPRNTNLVSMNKKKQNSLRLTQCLIKMTPQVWFILAISLSSSASVDYRSEKLGISCACPPWEILWKAGGLPVYSTTPSVRNFPSQLGDFFNQICLRSYLMYGFNKTGR